MRNGECWYDCAWVCVTEQGYGCAIAFMAINHNDTVGINLEEFEESVRPILNTENETEITD